jgi:hypothetical protein
MQNYESTYNQIIDKIKSARRKENSSILFNGLFKTLGLTLAVLMISVFIESLAHGDTLLRTILAGCVFVTFVVSFGIFLYPGLIRALNIKNNPTIDDIALRIGNHYPEIKDNLCNAIQLIPITKNPRGMSPSLALAAFEHVAEMIQPKDFNIIVKDEEIKKNLILFFIAAVIFAGSIGLFQSTLGEAFFRVVNFRSSFLPPVPFTIDISPLNETLVRGDKAKIEVRVGGIAPQTIKLHIKEELQEKFDVIELRPTIEGKFQYEFNSLKNSIEFFASSEWYSDQIETKHGMIKIIDKPIVKAMNGRLIYPSYTKLAPKNFDEKNADLTGLVGSRVSLDIIVNKDIKNGKIVFIKREIANIDTAKSNRTNDSLFYDLKIEGRKASGEFIIKHSGYYFIEIEDKENYKNESPINYTIVAQNDYYPEISLIEPISDVEINANGLLAIKFKMSDDYGFSTLKLFYRLAESPYTSPDEKFSSIDIGFSKEELSLELTYIWDLNKLSIMPDDKFEFYLEIKDNDIISGPKSAKTQAIGVRLPSLREIQKESEMSQQKVEQNLEKLMKEALDVKKDMEELNKDLIKQNNKQKEADWKDKKKAEDIMKKQDALKEKLSDIQKNLEDATKSLQENNLISPETLEKYQELQNLMKQVDSPELKMMQQKMQQALQKMNQEQLKKAMEQVKFNDEQFRKNIERALNLLKRLQAEQKADALQKRAEDLQKQQDALAEQTEKTNPKDQKAKDELSKRQEKLQSELKNLNKDLLDLEKLMKEIGEKEMPMDDLKDAEESLNMEETSSEMQTSKENMEKSDMEKSSKSQKKASKNLKNFAEKMGGMKKKMQKQSKEETMRQMQKSISDLQELSKQQESVKNKTAGADYNSTSIPQFAQNQAELFESMANVAKGMSELSQKSFAVTQEMGVEMSNGLTQMRDAVEKMADRNTQGASQNQGQAMSSMNKAIGQMQEMMSAMKKQGSGSCDNPGGTGQGEGDGDGKPGSGMSFSQKMQQIAAEQQAINQALQKMMQGGSGQGGKMSMEQQAMQGKLADKQGGAQKSVDELAKEQKNYAPNKQKLGELERISAEMKEIMSEIKSKGATPETLKRQERILSRLLDATKSVYDRDYEKKREAKPGQDMNNQSPAELDMNNLEGNQRAFLELLRNNQQGYTKDYENLIKSYFEKLKNGKQ